MENISPTLELILYLKNGIESGVSARTTMVQYCQNHTGQWPQVISKWMMKREAGADSNKLILQMCTQPLQQALMRLIDRALRGEPVYPAVLQLQVEIVEVGENEIELFLQTLPLKMLLPLLFFHFPAFLILLLGPLLLEFMRGFSM